MTRITSSQWRALLPPVLLGLVIGLAYEAAVFVASGGRTRRVPSPYAVPIFDTPFALVAVGIGYLCLERHRLRQDFRSARDRHGRPTLPSHEHVPVTRV